MEDEEGLSHLVLRLCRDTASRMRRAAVAAALQNPHAAAATAVPVPPPVLPPGDGGLSAVLPHVMHVAAAAAQGAGTAAQAVWPNNPLLHPVIACKVLWRGATQAWLLDPRRRAQGAHDCSV